MSNSNTNLQTQSSNALHNAIMEAGSKDRPPMLAPGNYVQWKSIIKRYIDTKPNSELIHYCLQNPPYTYQWAEKTVLVAEDQLNAEAEAVQIIHTGIDNDNTPQLICLKEMHLELLIFWNIRLLGVPLCPILHCLLILLQLVEIILFIVDSGCSKHMTGNLKLLTNFVEKFLGTVKFGNDQIAPILGYGDLVQGAITIKRVYYVEGLNHNLFSVGQFCDADLEVAFQKSTCYIRD
ncbi:hypothetical protein Tco_0196445 [Tanacetum coccineum]